MLTLTRSALAVVAWWTVLAPGTVTAAADVATAARVVLAVLADQRVDGVDAGDIEVAVVDGVATLRGRVASDEGRGAAEAAARGVEGVRAVRNELVVAPGGAVPDLGTDELLARAVVEAFQVDAVLAGAPIAVTVEGGVVRLTGDVADVVAAARASRVARQVVGVRAVRNALRSRRAGPDGAVPGRATVQPGAQER